VQTPNKAAPLIHSSADRRAATARDSDSREMASVLRASSSSKSVQRQWLRRRQSSMSTGLFSHRAVQCGARLNSNAQVSFNSVTL